MRTNDLELVGDGSHLTYFEMVGNFQFGNYGYDVSVEMWDSIIRDLRLPVTHVTCHPDRGDHRTLWGRRGYEVRPDESCKWSDGEIGGECCELFVGDLEIGNLVNPLGHSVDVGFGLERIHQVVEGKGRVDETSLFDVDGDPVLKDHWRSLCILWESGVPPGGKGRNYVCRRLLRRMLDLVGGKRPPFQEWVDSERVLRENRLVEGRRHWRKFRDRPPEFWRETFGIMPDEIEMLK